MKKYPNSSSHQPETNLEEHVLWRDVKEGDVRAFETIYRNYIQLTYNYGRKITSDEELVRDCIQDLFTDIWKNREKLGNIVSIRYYLYASIRRRIIRKRQQRARHFIDTPFSSEYSSEPEVSYEEELISQERWNEQRESLQNGLKALNRKQREAIELKFYKNLSYQEVADKMSLTVTNVYKIISRGLKVMEQHTHKATPLLLYCLLC